MLVVKTTRSGAARIKAIVDQAYGYPSRPTRTRAGTALPAKVPTTWDGTGATPFGWTKSQYEEYELSASDSWVPLEDDARAIVAASQAVSAADKALIAGAAREDVPDVSEGGTRTPKANAAVAQGGQVAAEEKR